MVIDVDSSVIENLEKKLQLFVNMVLKLKFLVKPHYSKELPHILANCNVKKLVIDLIEEVLETNDSKSVENEINKICSRWHVMDLSEQEETFKLMK